MRALSIGSRALTVTRRPRARQLCIPVQYGLPGTVLVLKQATPETSWAVQVTTLMAWRDDAPLSVDAAIAKIGERWEEKYAAKAALTADETSALIAAAGLCASPPQSLSPEGWEAMLRAYGPLIVLGEDVTFPVRGQIVVGIVGDGQPNGTKLDIIDTADGARKTELLSAFATPRRLVHWHADAGLGKGKHATVPPAGEPVAAPVNVSDPAKAPGPGPGPGQTSGTTNGSAALLASMSLSRRRSHYGLARATSAPAWDLPANFPTVIRDFWARQSSRLHHYIWHRARTDWPSLDATDMQAFKRLGFTAPTRLAGTRTRGAAAGAGLDFLGMHREMVAATRQLAINEKLQYRPTGWSPIPWRHDDADWPMPVWSGPSTPAWKDARMTGAFRTQVRDQFENATWLASVSLDTLGTALEETIHNWMHMHWATEQPPDINSSDWLGSTSSSQVNPRFWKLHGWIDDTITRWESAASGRSAAAEFAAIGGIWLGPVPRVRATELHDHGDITEDEAAQLLASIDMSGSRFPFADLSTDEMIAKMGPIGDVPQEFIADARGGGGDTSLVASLSARRSLVGFERHGARGMEVDPISIGSGVFSVLQTIASGGDFSFESAGAEYVHPSTPPQTLASRTTWDFELIAHHPRIGQPKQHFWFELQYTWNGSDLRDIRVDVLRDKSSGMISSKFSVKFAPVATSLPADPLAVVTYVISGRWDPILTGDFSYGGELKVRADGRVTLQITRADQNMVWHGQFTNPRTARVPTPTVNLVQETVFFSPEGSDKVTPESERTLLNWLDTQLADANHGAGLKNGTLVIHLLGHASTTNTDTFNRELSRKRAEKVERIIRDHVPTAKLEIRALGERESGTPDETADATQRYVRVWFEALVWPR